MESIGSIGDIGANFLDWWTMIFFLLRPFDLGPQVIPEALRAALRDLGSTFGPSETLPGLEKIEILKNRKYFSKKKVQKIFHFKENLYSVIVSGSETPPNLFAVKFYKVCPEGKFLRWSEDEFSTC